MSDQGVFQVHRRIFEHSCFAPEPFTEREAWIWMIGSAVWADKRVRVGRMMIELKRGQLAFATRFLAERWQWSHSKVVRFLNRLKTDTMIETQGLAEATRITICNYDQYQFGGNSGGTQAETPIETPAERPRNKEEELKHLRKENDGVEKRAKLISDDAHETAEAIAAACGFADPKTWPLGWYGLAAWVQKCFNEGWPAALMIEGARVTAARKRDGPIENFKYLEKPLARFIAEQSAPLPKVEVREAEKLTVTHGRNARSGNISDACDKLVELAHERYRRALSEDGSGNGANENPVGSLPYWRG